MEKLKPAAAQNARKTEKGTPLYSTSRFGARGLARNNSLHNDYESDVLFCDKHVKYLMDLLHKNMVSHALNWEEVCVRVQDVSLRSQGRWSQSQISGCIGGGIYFYSEDFNPSQLKLIHLHFRNRTLSDSILSGSMIATNAVDN